MSNEHLLKKTETNNRKFLAEAYKSDVRELDKLLRVNETILLATDCFYINRFGYVAITNNNLIFITYEAEHKLLGTNPKKLGATGEVFVHDKIHQLISHSIGKVYCTPDKNITTTQSKTRKILPIARSSISKLSIRKLFVFKRNFTLEKIPLFEAVITTDEEIPNLTQPIFPTEELATQFQRILISN